MAIELSVPQEKKSRDLAGDQDGYAVFVERGAMICHDSWGYGALHSHGDTPKWMVYQGKSLKMDDLGVPLFHI